MWVFRQLPAYPLGPTKVAGQFGSFLQRGEIRSAAQLLSFERLTVFFQEVGVAPNTTDGKCCTWIVDLAYQPLVKILRDPSSTPHDLLYFVAPFVDEVRKPFEAMASLRSVVEIFDSWALLAEVADGNAPKHLTSDIRSAIGKVDNLGNTSALGLATQHAELAKRIRAANMSLVTVSAQDAVARKQIDDAKVALNHLLATEDVSNFRAPMCDIISSIGSLTAASLEVLSGTVAHIFEVLSGMVKLSTDNMFGSISASFAAMAHDAIKAFLQFRATEASSQPDTLAKQDAETTKSPLPVYFADDFINQLVPMILEAQSEFQHHSGTCLALLQTCERMMAKARVMYDSAGVKVDIGCFEAPAGAHMQEVVMVINLFLEVFACLACFSNAMARTDFKALLEEWMKPQSAGEDQAHQYVLVGDPRKQLVLRLLLHGALNSEKVAAFLDRNGASVGHAPLDDLLKSMRDADLMSCFTKATTNLVGDALLEVQRCSFIDALMPQDTRSVNKVADSSTVLSMAKRLVGSPWRLTADETWVAIVAQAQSALHPSQQQRDLAFMADWSHHKPVNLAKQCVNMLTCDAKVAPWAIKSRGVLLGRPSCEVPTWIFCAWIGNLWGFWRVFESFGP